MLAKYHLPVHIKLDTAKVMEILRMDKKRHDEVVDYIVLEKIGKARVAALPFNVLIEKALNDYGSNEIEPGRVNGIITAPSSKSHTQRAYAAALLHTGKSVIRKAGQSADEDAALNIIRQLGARVTEPAPGTLEILSSGVVLVTNHIDCGESGLAARLFTPVAGIAPHEIKDRRKRELIASPDGRNRPAVA